MRATVLAAVQMFLLVSWPDFPELPRSPKHVPRFAVPVPATVPWTEPLRAEPRLPLLYTVAVRGPQFRPHAFPAMHAVPLRPWKARQSARASIVPGAAPATSAVRLATLSQRHRELPGFVLRFLAVPVQPRVPIPL